MFKIAITGPESTGKTTLAKQLAAHFQTTWVPEYARDYMDKLDRPYHLQDILTIAKKQLQEEDRLQLQAQEILVCDTELVVTKIWSEFVYGACPEWIEDQLEVRKYDLYLLMNIDIPWVYDPQREHPEQRKHLFKIYKRQLEEMGVNYVVVSGKEEHRFQNALKAIQKECAAQH